MTSSLKILSITLVLVLVSLLQVTNGQYFTIGEKYYRAFTSQKVNWYQAYQFCATLGMELATIENESDLTALRKSLFDESLLSNNFWLAGNNLANSRDYIWVTSGNKFAYTKWSPSQPGSLANRCVHTNSNFDWVTDSCYSYNYFICSKPLVPDCGPYGQCSDGLTYLYDL